MLFKLQIGKESHVNMLKCCSAVLVMSVSAAPYHPSEDGLTEKSASMPAARLRNSEVLSNLESFLAHLSDPAHSDIITLINDNLLLFSDHPRQTSVLFHDIDVECHKSIKPHAYK